MKKGFNPINDKVKIKRAEQIADLSEHSLNASAIDELESYDYKLTQRKEEIKEMLEASGIEFLDNSSGEYDLTFAKPEVRDGVEYSLNRLILNPNPNEDSTHPWLGKGYTVATAKALLKKLKVPSWALSFKQAAIDSISKPQTEGMINASGEANKDLQQLMSVHKPIVMSPQMAASCSAAKQRMTKDFRTWARRSEQNSLYEVTNEGKIRLRLWTEDEFRAEMAKAIAHGSPGYPYNGSTWNSICEQTGKEIATRVYEDGVSQIHDPKPFVYIQSARYTGDGADNDADGKQRLVQMAPAREKLLGHIISYPLKKYIRKPGSGQMGIDAVTRTIKDLATGGEQLLPEAAGIEPEFASDADVSRWDGHIQDFQDDEFFEFVEEVYDMDDEETRLIIEAYKIGHKSRYLVTGLGYIRTRMLPSGSSITTVFTFVIHERYLLTAQDLLRVRKGTVGFCSYGLQGDDLWFLCKDPEIIQTLKEVYECMGCEIKGTPNVVSLKDSHPAIVFLNELIYLRDKNGEVPNFVFPKWNFFWAENSDQLHRTISLDRNILAEIKNRLAHVTPVELLMASFLGKMDRLSKQGYYKYLLERLWYVNKYAGRAFQLRSWRGTRVCPTSPTVEALRELEEANDVNTPNEINQMIDREEELYLTTKELAAAAYIGLFAMNHGCAADIRKRVVNYSYSYGKEKKRAASAVDRSSTIPLGTRASLDDYNDVVTIINKAFESAYMDFAMRIEEQRSISDQTKLEAGEVADQYDSYQDSPPTEKMPVTLRRFLVSLLAMNEADPYNLRMNIGKIAANMWANGQLEGVPDNHRDKFCESFKELMGYDIDSLFVQTEE